MEDIKEINEKLEDIIEPYPKFEKGSVGNWGSSNGESYNWALPYARILQNGKESHGFITFSYFPEDTERFEKGYYLNYSFVGEKLETASVSFRDKIKEIDLEIT
jgi:hypothetical protein